MTLELLIRAWPLFVALIGIVAWFVRLEARLMYLEQDNARYRQDAKEKETAMWGKIDSLHTGLNSILTAVTRLDVKMENLNKGETK